MTVKTKQSIPKYRPVLSGEQIIHIIALCKREGSSESLRLAADLSRMEWQIRNGGLTPAYVEEPRESLSEALGFSLDHVDKAVEHLSSLPIHEETLYQKWLENPSQLSTTEIANVRKWRYTNNKMTMDEEKLFEKEILGVS